MKNSAFEYKSPNAEKLIKYGFSYNGKSYSYITEILDGQFEMRVNVSADGKADTEVIDLNLNEAYTLHLVEDACGAFVGEVRAEYERVLNDVAENCFDRDVFKGECAHAVIDYARKKYGDELEYLWKTFPSNAVLRRKDTNKWYAALLTVQKRKLGLEDDGEVCVIDLRGDPELLPKLTDGKRYFQGYHMNKKHWFTICLDGSVSVEDICNRLDKSYELAKK